MGRSNSTRFPLDFPRAPEGLAAGSALSPGAELASRVIAYDPRADAALITSAYDMAAKAHAPQKRDDGQPYIVHPLAVAEILAGYRLDTGSIITALLHDTVEDTSLKLGDIESSFGKEVARLVDGVTKLTRLELQSERTKQAENFRKLVLAMSEDIRVLLIKLADRLHNMRTISGMPQLERRRKQARETLEIYAPLAERIGMDALKTELETLSFREMNAEAWQTIAARLTYLRGQGADLIDEIEADVRRVLADAGVTVVDIQGREKSPYSIWLKMQKKNVAFEQLSDIMAFRIIVPEKGDCYAALGAIHSAYRVVPGRFKDWISTPKTNGYQSLHSGVTVPERRNAKIEVQIRTKEMHDIAENGVAAHWSYKQGPASGRDQKRYPWVRDLLEILENAAEPQEFLEHTKLELHRDRVFCFTPKGDLIELPRGATPVDFAYEVHSQVGDSTVGAKVNGKIVPLRHALENGDQVEIITARGGTPNPGWERFVVTGKARAHIRRVTHARQRAEQREEGRSAIAKAFRAAGLDFSEKLAEPALKPLKQADFEAMCVAVATGNLSPRDVLNAAVPELRAAARGADPLALARPRGRLGAGPTLMPGKAERPSAAKRDAALGVRGLVTGMAVSFAGCCHPLPGDRILGIVTTGRGVTIHRQDCHGLEAFVATPERFIDVDWDYDGATKGTHVARVELVAENRPDALAGVTTAIARQEGAVNNLRIANRAEDWCEVIVDVEVRDISHLTAVLAALRACPGVTQVERGKG